MLFLYLFMLFLYLFMLFVFIYVYWTAGPSGVHEFNPGFGGIRVTRSLAYNYCVVFCRLLFVNLSFFFLLVIVLSLLRFTTSDYPFGHCVVCPS